MQKVRVILNGEDCTLEKPLLSDLLARLTLPRRFALAVNQEVVPKSLWHSVELKEGDEIEVVAAVGGG